MVETPTYIKCRSRPESGRLLQKNVHFSNAYELCNVCEAIRVIYVQAAE